MPFYAVRIGRNPGIYTSWKECREQTHKYSQAFYGKFDTEIQAEDFLYDARINCDRAHVEVYTDGACLNNGRKGAAAGIGVYWGPSNPWNVGERLPGIQTNNRAELLAAERALRQAMEMGEKHVTLYTDSLIVINGITEWINMWKRNGWKTAAGDNVINREEYEALDRARMGLCVQWIHVRGHQSCVGNQEADRLAVAGAHKSY